MKLKKRLKEGERAVVADDWRIKEKKGNDYFHKTEEVFLFS